MTKDTGLLGAESAVGPGRPSVSPSPVASLSSLNAGYVLASFPVNVIVAHVFVQPTALEDGVCSRGPFILGLYSPCEHTCMCIDRDAGAWLAGRVS